MDMPQAVKEQLTCSMKEMLRTKPVPRIRINQLCRGSGIRRRAFRSEFRSKHRFLEWMFYSEFMPRMTGCRGNSERFLYEACAYFDENRAMYRTILTPRRRNARRSIRNNAKRNALLRSFSLIAPILARELILARYPDAATRDALLGSCGALVEMYRDALFGWLQSDEPAPPDAFARACLAQLDEYADVSAQFGAAGQE